MRGRNACETHAFYLRNYGGFYLVSSYETSTHTGYYVKVEIHIPTVWTTDSCSMQAHWGHIFYIIIIFDIYNLKQYIIIFILLFKSLE
jgi:hypothetical protein